MYVRKIRRVFEEIEAKKKKIEAWLLKKLWNRIFREEFGIVALDGIGNMSGVRDDDDKIIFSSNGIQLVGFVDRDYQGIALRTFEVKRSLSFQQFFEYITSGCRERILVELQEKIKDAAASFCLERTKNESFKSISQAEIVKRHFDAISNEFCGNLMRDITEIKRQDIEEIIGMEMRKTKNEILTRVEEAVDSGVFTDFEQKTLSGIGKEFLKRESTFNNIAQETVVPRGTRFFFTKGERAMVVIEQEPQVKTIRFSEKFLKADFEWSVFRLWRQTGSQQFFSLAFPYVIFVLTFWKGRFETLQLFYAKKPLSSTEDMLYTSNLPNIYTENGRVCFSFYDDGSSNSMSDTADEVIARFWGSTFTEDMELRYKAQKSRNRRFRNVMMWEKASEKNPLFVLKVKFQDSGYTIQKLYREILTDEEKRELLLYNNLVKSVFDRKKQEISDIIWDFWTNIDIKKLQVDGIARRIEKFLEDEMKILCDDLIAKANENSNGKQDEFISWIDAKITLLIKGILESSVSPISPAIDTETIMRKIRNWE